MVERNRKLSDDDIVAAVLIVSSTPEKRYKNIWPPERQGHHDLLSALIVMMWRAEARNKS